MRAQNPSSTQKANSADNIAVKNSPLSFSQKNFSVDLRMAAATSVLTYYLSLQFLTHTITTTKLERAQ